MRKMLAAVLTSLALQPLVAPAADLSPATPLFAATLWDVADKPAALSAYKGRPLVVNFWARWCTPCREEIPDLSKLRAKYKAKGIEVIGIAIEDKGEPVLDFAKAYDIDYPVVLAKNQGLELMKALGNVRAGLPYTIAIDRQGRIVTQKLGRMQRADMEAAAVAALK